MWSYIHLAVYHRTKKISKTKLKLDPISEKTHDTVLRPIDIKGFKNHQFQEPFFYAKWRYSCTFSRQHINMFLFSFKYTAHKLITHTGRLTSGQFEQQLLHNIRTHQLMALANRETLPWFVAFALTDLVAVWHFLDDFEFATSCIESPNSSQTCRKWL